MMFCKFINREHHLFDEAKGLSLNAMDFRFVKTRDQFTRPKWHDGRKYRQLCNVDGINKKKATHLGLVNKSYEWED